MTQWVHSHWWEERDRHENDDRIRTRDECTICGAARYGCCAKRLGLGPGVTVLRVSSDGAVVENPDNAPRDYEVWGPVGQWQFTVEDP